ncbi:MAG: hypothetical protein EXR86_01105 [Gammaproteobacteria bacterium]|nr:hypothetical protein [Gammaproteobacteria bacterium]
MSFKDRWNRDKLTQQARRGFRGYPVATIAFYGPTNQRASKVVVGIVRAEGEAPDVLNKWYSDTADVRTDETISSDIKEFIKLHAAKSVVVTDAIMGCPHQEGIDYPDGEKCPQCPFWATRDRFTGQLLH